MGRSDKACQLQFDRLKGNVDRCLSIRKWILDHDAEKDHDDVKVKIKLKDHPSIGQWLLDSYEYKAWLGSAKPDTQAKFKSVVWVRGAVGTGKTSLIARVIEQHRLTSYAHHDYRLAYFYCANQEASGRRSYQAVLMSLLRQAAYDPVRGTVAAAVRRAHGQGENSFLFSECENLLMAIMKEGIKLRIVVDALDECDEPDKLLKALHEVAESAPSQCQLLVSGRPEVQVQRIFPKATMIDVQKHTTLVDMRNYITKEVKHPDSCDRIYGGEREDLEDRLIDILGRKANGMFEWVRLQLALFTAYHETGSADTLQDLEELENDATLVGLKELNKIYDKIFNKNTRDKRTSREAAKFMYQLLIGCPSRVRMEEMIYILNIRFSSGEEFFKSTDILKYGSNFITIVQDIMLQYSCLEFTHISAKQYLQSEHEGYDSTTCDITSLRLCIKYWGESDLDLEMAEKVFNNIRRAQRFFTEWFYTCWNRLSRKEREEPGIVQLFLDCLVYGDGRSSFESWLPGMFANICIHLGSKINAPSTRITIQSPLDFAACRGFTDVVEAICASPREHMLERTVNRALFIAKDRGRMGVIDFLLNRFQINNPNMEFDLSDLTPAVDKDEKLRIIWRPGDGNGTWALKE